MAMTDPLNFTLHFLAHHVEEAARVLEKLSPEDTSNYLEELGPKEAQPVMENLLPWYLARCLAEMETKTAVEHLNTLSSFRASRVLRLLEPRQRREVLEGLPGKKKRTLVRQMEFPLNTVGGWMDAFVPTLPETATVGEALDYTRQMGPHAINHLFVMRRDGHYIGGVPIGKLIYESEHRPVKDLLDPNLNELPAQATLASVRFDPAWNHSNALPVVNGARQVEGLLRAEQVQEGLGETEQSDSESGSLLMGLVPLFTIVARAWVQALVALPFMEEPQTKPTEGKHGR